MLGFSPLSSSPLSDFGGQASTAGNASGTIASINLSAPTGAASGRASASGLIASISLVSPNGSAANSGSIPAFATGDIRTIYLTAPNGFAVIGTVTYASAPDGGGYRRAFKNTYRPPQ